MSMASAPAAWPPLTTAARGPSATRSRAAWRRSSRVGRDRPSSTSASGMLGVTTAATGSRYLYRDAMASLCSSLAPPLATMTGSTTRFRIPCSLIAAATASMISALASIPVLAACTPMSSTTASIWARITRIGTSWISETVTVFWAVTAVIADVPCTPKAAKVLRSAWMPAPPPESEPAIVSATGTFKRAPRRAASCRPHAARAQVDGGGDCDTHQPAGVGSMEARDETVVEEVGRGDQVAEEVVVVDEQQAGRGAGEPRDYAEPRSRFALKDEEAQEHDRGPGRRPQIGEDEEVLVGDVQVAHQHRVCGQRRAEDAAAQRGLPSREADSHCQCHQPRGVDVEVVGPDLTYDDKHEERDRDPAWGVRADHGQDAPRAGGKPCVDGRQQEAEEAEEDHRQRHAGERPEGDGSGRAGGRQVARVVACERVPGRDQREAGHEAEHERARVVGAGNGWA